MGISARASAISYCDASLISAAAASFLKAGLSGVSVRKGLPNMSSGFSGLYQQFLRVCPVFLHFAQNSLL